MAWLRRLLGTARVGGTRNAIAGLPRSRPHGRQALDRVTALEEAVAGDEENADLWMNLGQAWFEIDAIDEAAVCFGRVLAIDPRHCKALNGLANAHKEQGDLAGAIALYRRAIEARPDDAEAFQNLLFAMLCSNEQSEESILGWHQRFAGRFEAPLARLQRPHANILTPDRRIRIGYVSPDFRRHVVGFCIAPVIENHDRAGFAAYCYFNGSRADDLTESIRAKADAWRDVSRMTDAQFDDLVREDLIDILVDLSGHTPGNRLLAFARRPAPIQVGYLDYSATTGLASIGFRLTDAACDPPGIADAYYTERLIRLPGTFWLYNPPALPESARPEASRREITFGCMNSFYRVNDAALSVWAGVLRRLPGSRLVLAGVPAGEASASVARRLGALGIAAQRLSIFGLLRYEDYVDLIRSVDVALGPFPYNGAMTLLDCLWQGVPVVSMRGAKTFHSRMADSICSALKLEELLAESPASYADIAVRLAADREGRIAYRSTLRNRILASPLCDYAGFTRVLEHAYRGLWRAHCGAALRPSG